MSNTLKLEGFEEEAYLLFAIYSSASIFKMAFLLNKHLDLRLKRNEKDVVVEGNIESEIYPYYIFDDIKNYSYYTLLKNKYTFKQHHKKTTSSTDNLFGNTSEKILTKNLIPEFKKVDYFLKIETDNNLFDSDKITSNILSINQVITSNSVDYKKIKTKNNLIII